MCIGNRTNLCESRRMSFSNSESTSSSSSSCSSTTTTSTVRNHRNDARNAFSTPPPSRQSRALFPKEDSLDPPQIVKRPTPLTGDELDIKNLVSRQALLPLLLNNTIDEKDFSFNLKPARQLHSMEDSLYPTIADSAEDITTYHLPQLVTCKLDQFYPIEQPQQEEASQDIETITPKGLEVGTKLNRYGVQARGGSKEMARPMTSPTIAPWNFHRLDSISSSRKYYDHEMMGGKQMTFPPPMPPKYFDYCCDDDITLTYSSSTSVGSCCSLE